MERSQKFREIFMFPFGSTIDLIHAACHQDILKSPIARPLIFDDAIEASIRVWHAEQDFDHIADDDSTSDFIF